MIIKEYFPFSWGYDRWLDSKHVCSREKLRKHYTSCELFLHIPLLKDRKQWVCLFPILALSLGFSVSCSYGVVISD